MAARVVNVFAEAAKKGRNFLGKQKEPLLRNVKKFGNFADRHPKLVGWSAGSFLTIGVTTYVYYVNRPMSAIDQLEFRECKYREAEKQVFQAMLRQEKVWAVALSGPPDSGKTCFLQNQLLEYKKATGCPVVAFDFRNMDTSVHSLLSAMQLSFWSYILGKIPYLGPTPGSTFGHMVQKLNKQSKGPKPLIPILFIDEAHRLSQLATGKDDEAKVAQQIFEGIIDFAKKGKLRVVLASSEGQWLEKGFTRLREALGDRFALETLGALSEKDARAYFKENCESKNFLKSLQYADLVYEVFGGHVPDIDKYLGQGDGIDPTDSKIFDNRRFFLRQYHIEAPKMPKVMQELSRSSCRAVSQKKLASIIGKETLTKLILGNHLSQRTSPDLDFELRDKQGRPLFAKDQYNVITVTAPCFMYLWSAEFSKEYPEEKCGGGEPTKDEVK